MWLSQGIVFNIALNLVAALPSWKSGTDVNHNAQVDVQLPLPNAGFSTGVRHPAPRSLGLMKGWAPRALQRLWHPQPLPLPEEVPMRSSQIVMLADLELRRFGHKCNDAELSETTGTIMPTRNMDLDLSLPDFFQMGSNTSNSSMSALAVVGNNTQVSSSSSAAKRAGLLATTTPADHGSFAGGDVSGTAQPAEAEVGVMQDAPLVLRDGEDLQGTAESEELSMDRTVVDNSPPGFFAQHGVLVFIFFLISAALMLGTICFFIGFWALLLSGRSETCTPRGWVEGLQKSGAEEVQQLFPSDTGYDCHISRPISSKRVLRLEAIIEGPLEGPPLTAPFSGRPCVLFSTAVSRRLHDGIPPVPVAFASSHVDFAISLAGAPHLRLNLSGADVSLFDVGTGRLLSRKALADAPDHWQDFVSVHRSGSFGRDWQSAATHLAEAAPLEFQECALFVGSSVTVVGELHRGADGALFVRPCIADHHQAHNQGDKAVPAQLHREGWRASWECTDGKGDNANASAERQAKVFVSDDPSLLRAKSGWDNLISKLKGYSPLFPVVRRRYE